MGPRGTLQVFNISTFQHFQHFQLFNISIVVKVQHFKVEAEVEMLSHVIIEHKGCDVGVGSGFSQEERKLYFKNPELIIGKTITVQYFEETINQDGCHSLRFPVVKHIYENGRNV